MNGVVDTVFISCISQYITYIINGAMTARKIKLSFTILLCRSNRFAGGGLEADGCLWIITTVWAPRPVHIAMAN